MSWFDFLNTTAYTFEGKKDDERVVMFLHRHWFTVISRLIVLIICSVSPIAVFVVLGQQITSHGLITIFAFIWACMIMICWFIFFYTLTMYTLDTWLVTNLRIINSAQEGFFDRTVSELHLGNIQDVSIKTEGPVATMMNFGDIEVQTAGGEHHFTFKDIPNPQSVKDAVVNVVEEFKTSHPNSSSL